MAITQRTVEEASKYILESIENWKSTGQVQILAQNGHPFLSKADSNSCGKRTVIPAENGHGFLLKADSRPF